MEAHISVLVYSPDQSAKMPPDRNKVKMHDDGCKLYHEEERQRSHRRITCANSVMVEM